MAAALVSCSCRARAQSAALPESPGHLLLRAGSGPNQTPVAQQSSSTTPQDAAQQSTADKKALRPCDPGTQAGTTPNSQTSSSQSGGDLTCTEENPLQPIIASPHVRPLEPHQKAYLAARDVIDPFNLITILGYSGVSIAANAHTAYGPGLRGFGRLTGYSLVEDMQGEFFGTFLVPSLAHEDPRYYRMPGKPFSRRLVHAVSHTVWTRHDDGSGMPNYATLLTYPISAELTNLYVPGVAVNAASTAKRVGLGLATDPVGGIVAEFLPDVAKHIHIRIIFVQQILQQVAQGGTGGPVMTQ